MQRSVETNVRDKVHVGNRSNSKSPMVLETRSREKEKDNEMAIKSYRQPRTVFTVIIYAAYMLFPSNPVSGTTLLCSKPSNNYRP